MRRIRLIVGVWGLAAAAGCAAASERAAVAAVASPQAAAAAQRAANAADPNQEITADAVDGTLAAYVAVAMARRPALRAAFEEWKAQVYRIAAARRLPDPQISYGFYVRQVHTRVGPQRHRLSLRQSFPWPTALSSRADAASARAEAARRRFDAAAVAVAHQVAAAYWRLWQAGEEQREWTAHREVVTTILETARARLATNRATLADVQQVALTLAQVDDAVANQQERLRAAAAELAGAVGVDVEVVRRHGAVEAPPEPPIDIDESWLADVRAHPRFAAMDEEARAWESVAAAERARRLPGFTVGVDWIETGNRDDADVPNEGQDALIAQVGIAVPLWQAGYRRDVAAAHAAQRAAAAAVRDARLQAQARFRARLADLADLQRQIRLYRDTLIAQAQGVLESQLGAYAVQQADVAAVLLAQAELIALRRQLVVLRSRLGATVAELEDLAGRTWNPLSGWSDQARKARKDRP